MRTRYEQGNVGSEHVIFLLNKNHLVNSMFKYVDMIRVLSFFVIYNAKLYTI